MGKAKGRNYYLDIFKLFASYMVVLMNSYIKMQIWQ